MPKLRYLSLCLAAILAACAILASPALAQSDSGGVSPDDPRYATPGKATLVNGKAIAPPDAPPEIKAAIAAANRIVGKPYKYGGGHARVEDSGYDCSGTVSYALRGGGLLRTPLDSSGFMRWGRRGKGRWITVYTNPGHAYVVVAGLRFDTSMRDDPSRTGPGWSRRLRRSASFMPRHPRGY
jgi:cell wall-associated NlpC family hydrolase